MLDGRRPPGRLSLLCCALWASLAACHATRAELPLARLTSAFPPGAQQGGTVEVTLTGQDLDGVTALHFSNPKVTAKPGPAPGKFVVTVPADAAPGICDVRAVGRYGVSNPRAFVVGPLPVTVPKPGNTQPLAAAPLAPGQAVFAVAEANIVHYYKLPLKKGQRVFAETDARTIDSRMEPSVTLVGTAGQDLVIARRGELIDFTAPADGDYQLKVNDSTYRGGPEFFYRLSVHAGPQVDFIDPPAGLPGAKGKYTLIGRNLPGGAPAPGMTIGGRPLETLPVEIELPAADAEKLADSFSFVPSPGATLDGIDYRLTTPGGVSNAVRIGFATAPVVLKDPTAKASAGAAGQKVAVPCEVAGRFLPRGERDVFTFDAPAKSVFCVEIFSHRLGYPTAPFLLVQKLAKDAKGVETFADVQEVYEAPADPAAPLEFRTASRDPAYRLAVAEAGVYRVVVRNLFTPVGDDGSFVYRLAIRKEAPDFRLVALPGPPVVDKDSKEAPIVTPLLRRGGITPIKVIATRQDKFDGAIELKVEGLPEGVTAAPVVLAPTATAAVILLWASESAKPGITPLRVTGMATINGAPVTRAARAGTVATSAYDAATKTGEVASRRARDLFLAVSAEPTPLLIALAKDGPLETCIANKLTIPIKITRRGEFAGPIPLKLAGHPLLVPLKEVTVAPDATTASIELDLTTIKLPVGTYTLDVESLAKVKYAPPAAEVKEPKDPKDPKDAKPVKQPTKDLTASFYSQPIQLTVTAAPITIPPPAAAAIDAGGKSEAPVTITRLYGYADPIDLALVAPNVKGLSGKVTLAKDQGQAKIALVADATTPPGDHVVKLEAKLKLGTQTITVEQPFQIKVSPAKPKAK